MRSTAWRKMTCMAWEKSLSVAASCKTNSIVPWVIWETLSRKLLSAKQVYPWLSRLVRCKRQLKQSSAGNPQVAFVQGACSWDNGVWPVKQKMIYFVLDKHAKDAR